MPKGDPQDHLRGIHGIALEHSYEPGEPQIGPKWAYLEPGSSRALSRARARELARARARRGRFDLLNVGRLHVGCLAPAWGECRRAQEVAR